jgi:dynactin complex subunit
MKLHIWNLKTERDDCKQFENNVKVMTVDIFSNNNKIKHAYTKLQNPNKKMKWYIVYL